MNQIPRKSLKERMAEKRASIEAQKKPTVSKESTTPALPKITEEDKELMLGFMKIVEDTKSLLLTEIEHIKRGDIDAVIGLAHEKQENARKMENIRPLVEKLFLLPEFKDNAESMKSLHDVSVENSVLLERMKEATGAIANQLKKLQQKNSIDGIYGYTGRLVSEIKKKSGKLDQTL